MTIPQPQRIEQALAYHRGRVAAVIEAAGEWVAENPRQIQNDADAAAVAVHGTAILEIASGILRSAALVESRAPTTAAAGAARMAYRDLFARLATAARPLHDTMKAWNERKTDAG